MKFIFLFLFALPALADVKDCRQFSATVLKPAVTFDEKAEDHGWRFVKEENKALEYIRSYDVSRLQIAEEIKLGDREIKDCKFFNDPKKNQLYCGNLFGNFDFLRGLIYGSKNYKWSPSTVDLANQKVKSFLQETTAPGTSFIFLALSYSLLEEMTGDKKVTEERAELEKAIKKLQEEAKKNSSKDCRTTQKAMMAERKAAEPFRAKLAARLQEMKK